VLGTPASSPRHSPGIAVQAQLGTSIPAMSLSPGSVVAGYTIVRPLGSGGMGQVYLAQHPRLPRQDALKILQPELSSDSEFRQRFIREADVAASLSHPNIVKVHDRGEFDGQLWIATEYVEGTDAGQLLRSYPEGMPVEEASGIASAIGNALDYAHESGLLHRDVKPANILLTHPDRFGRRQVYLADFGIARPLADPNGLTATNLTVGTVAYAAPEQLMGAEIDGRADQYALAATAFHLLTGTNIYDNSNPIAVISGHLNAPVPLLSERRPDLAPLDSAVRTALAKDPADRFETCSMFAKALAAGAGIPSNGPPTEAGLTMAAPTVVEPEPATPQRKSIPRNLLIAAAAVIGILALVAIGVQFTDRKPATTQGGGAMPPVAGVTNDGRGSAAAADSSNYKAEVVSFTQVGESLSVQLRNPNRDVGLVRSPFELALIDQSGAVLGTQGQGGLPGAPVTTIYQLPPGGDFGFNFAAAVPRGTKVSSVELTITGEWLQWDTVNPSQVTLTGSAVRPDSGFLGPVATGRLSLEEGGPSNVVVVAFIKTPAGTVVSTASVDCVRAGQNRSFETLAFGDVRGPYELENVVAYPTSVPGAGPQYTPSC